VLLQRIYSHLGIAREVNASTLRGSCRILLPALLAVACERGSARPKVRGEPAVSAPPSAPAPPDTDAYYGESPMLHESTAPPPGHGAPPAARDTGGAGDHLLLAVLDAYRDYAGLNAIAVVKPNGELRLPRIPSAMPAPEFPFARRWLDPGHAYTLLRHGRPSGRLTVRSGPMGCGVNGAARIAARREPRYWNGLATDLDVPAGPPLRRRATAAERRGMTALLRQAVSAHDTALWSADLSVAVDAVLLPGGAVTLVGSTDRRRENAVLTPLWSIFVIADGEGGTYRPGVTWWQRGEEATNPDLLLDAFDLDRDGTPEIFTTTAGDHGHQHTILRRDAGRWKVIFEAGGC
jgi:hypothetical protein